MERMSAGDPSVPLDELLAHREWVRRLALAISRDEHEADDVEQATWVAALRRPPTHRASLRGWLGTTVRRAAGRLRRAERRRIHHEAAAPPRSPAEDAAELASRADTHRRVVEALVALEEPLRRTLLLRYFEGLAVGEVALRTGVPLETCRARLRRGRALLRDRLERELGGRDALGAAVVLLAGREHGGGVAPAAGGVAMAATGTKVAAAVAVVAAVGAGVWWSRRDAPPPAETAAVAPVEAPRAPPVERAPTARAERAVAEADATVAAPAAPPAAAEPERTAQERLNAVKMSVEWAGIGTLDALGAVSSRTEVGFVADSTLVDELAKGGSEVTLHMEEVSASTMVSVLCHLTGLEAGVEPHRVVIRRQRSGAPDEGSLVPIPAVPRGPDGKPARLTFRVVDENGVPVVGASIAVAGSSNPVATTGPGGTTTVEKRLAPMKYVARMSGTVDSYVRVVEPSAPAEEQVEFRLRGRAARLRGTVRSAGGGPVAGAWVSWHAAAEFDRSKDPMTDRPAQVDPRRILTAEDGSFDERSADPGPGRLRVAGSGFAPLALELELYPGAETSQAVVLRPEAVCTGTVKSKDGDPVPRVTVTASLPSAPQPLASTLTRPDGTFRIVALPGGSLVLRVGLERSPRSPESTQLAETTVELTEGATTTWDPVVELPAR